MTDIKIRRADPINRLILSRRADRRAKAPEINGTDVFLYEEIGLAGVGALEFIREISDLNDINIRINSPGGDVFEGYAIYNALVHHPGHVQISVDGVALSIASAIAMAGDTRVIAENGLMMIHDPWTVAIGNAQDLRDEAEVLDLAAAGILKAYETRANEDLDIAQMMRDETWFDSEAVASGFNFDVKESLKIAANYDPSKYKNAPKIGISRDRYRSKIHAIIT